jgi:Multiubiquitin
MEKSQDNVDRNGFVPIQIDHKPYKAPKPSMTGGEIRRLAEPDIAADRDLFRVVPGPSDDVKIGDNEIVQLEPGMHFYSAPKTINPGDSTDAIA